jgi:UDP-glucose 4-epimerase
VIKKAVVVGGSGFIGSHVADSLTCKGYQVSVYDRSESQWLRKEQDMVIGDVRDVDKLKHAIADVDVVYNFAALSDLNQATEEPIETININILGNLNIMEACRLHNVSRFMYASTVYVNSREGGFYRCSKQASEAYIEEYRKKYGLDYTILRYGSLYGPRSDSTNGLYRVVQSALKNGIVSYKGDVDAMREYIHVDDAARASVDALGDEFKNESVVLTGQEPMRVIDMLKMLAEILGYPTESVEFIEGKYAGHYVRTPYAYQPKIGRKYIPPMHVDLGQGLLQIVNELDVNI